MTEEQVTILAISGSLRKESLNTRLIRNAIELAPEGVDIIHYDISDIPLYNGDLEVEAYPAAATHLKEALREADALLIATPEYNGSYPGVLKNTIDWVSRPQKETPFADKPVAIMGASGGQSGTVRAQQALRLTLATVGAILLPKPDVVVRSGGKMFDDDGRLNDEATQSQIQKQLERLADWAVRFRDPVPARRHAEMARSS